MPKYHSDRANRSAVRDLSTNFFADFAWGDPLYASSADLDAGIEHRARAARWARRKEVR